MQKTKKTGLVLTMVTALLSTMFAAMPANANVESSAVLTPTGAGASSLNTMVITEAFEMRLRYGTGVVGANNTDLSSESGTVTDASIHYVVNSTSAVLLQNSAASTTGYAYLQANSISATTANDGFIEVPSTSAFVRFSFPALTSVSPAVSITVTPFLDIDGQSGLTAGDSVGTPYTINFVPWSGLGASITLADPVADDQGATASVTVTAGNIRWSQLDGVFGIAFQSTNDTETNDFTVSAELEADATPNPTAKSGAQLVSDNYSFSANVLTRPHTTSATSVQSISAQLVYFSTDPGANGDLSSVLPGRGLTAIVTKGVAPITINNVTLSAVASANAIQTGADAASVRYNSAFTLRAYPHSTSQTLSIAVASAFTVSAVGAGIDFDADSGVILNGVTYTQSARFLAAGFTQPAGTTTIALSTFGQEAGSTETMDLKLTSQLKSKTIVVTLVTPTLTVADSSVGTVAGLAGSTRTFALEVEDQFGEAPVRTDLRVAASVNLGSSVSTTVSGAVVAGKASVTVTPVPATRTGSAVVTFTLQQFSQDTQAWTNVTTDTTTWQLFSYVAGTDAFTSRSASISASISYGVALSYSATAVAVKITNSFSEIVVSAPGLIIQNADATKQTASDTLTVTANGQNGNFNFTSRMAGTYTVTFTNGTATTTSQVIVNPARDADGANITFDTTAMPAASTKVITGTLVDANGNPVNTSGSATILVTYTVTGNAGIPIGTMPTETDADGKFTITVLTGANDRGTAVVSAAYYKSGAATPVAQVLTFNQSIVVGGAATAPASDQKLTVGSFKGFVAIYALNYTGQKLSAKVAGKWLVVNSLIRFERVVRNTGAAIPIVVDLYIDGKFVRTENIVTK